MNLPINLKFIAFITVSVIAIAWLFRTVIDREIQTSNNPEFSGRKQQQVWLKVTKFFRHPLVNTSEKSFFLLVTVYFLFDTLVKAYKFTLPGTNLADFRWFYVASKMIQQGINPYNSEAFISYFSKITIPNNASPFVYPPNIIPLIWPLSYFSIGLASAIWSLANLLAIIFLLWGSIKLLESQDKTLRFTCIIACLLIYGTTYNVRNGNVSAIVSAFLIWAIILAKSGKNLPAGILLGISTIKPTCVILFIGYFLLKKRLLMVAYCALVTIILGMIGLLITKDSLPEFFNLYKTGNQIFFASRYNNPYSSNSRIDALVIGARLFYNNIQMADFTSALLAIVPTLLVLFYIFKEQNFQLFSEKIDFSEITLVACLSLLIFYSQPVNSVILIIAVVFLLNSLLMQIKTNNLNPRFLWFMGCLFLMVHTNLYYYLINPGWKYTSVMSMTTIFHACLASLPNFSLLGLIISVFFLSLFAKSNQKIGAVSDGIN